MSKKAKVPIAITMGDAAGIGPEIIVKALERKDLRRKALPIVIGDAKTMEQALSIAKSNMKIKPIAEIGEAKDDPALIPVLDLKNIEPRQAETRQSGPAGAAGRRASVIPGTGAGYGRGARARNERDEVPIPSGELGVGGSRCAGPTG